MRRRDFVRLMTGAAVAWPLGSRAQQAMPLVGSVRSTTAAGFAGLEVALRQGLKESGYIEGRNVALEFHYGDNRPDRVSALIADLIRRRVSVIVGNNLAVLPAKAATTTVPIVFVTGGDPVRDGFVTSLNRPGGNLTGVTFLVATLGAKRLELLRRFVPKARGIAALVHRNSLQAKMERSDLPPAAQAMGLRLLFLEVDSERDFETAFATAVQGGVGALFVGGGGFLNSHRERLIALATRHKLPASFPLRDFVVEGGLMSYGPSQHDAYRLAGGYAARILRGEKPANMPVLQSTKFELVVNLKTAKALGLEFEPQLLTTVDEVIE